MNCCGIDLAGVSSDAYVTDEKGQKPWSGPLETKKAAFERLAKKVGRGGLPVAIEAGNQTAWVYEELVELGAKVTVVNPTKVKWIAESRRKTDKVDAKILCELLRLDALSHPVHMPGPQARELRGLLAARRQLVSARSQLCNVVRGMLRQRGVHQSRERTEYGAISREGRRELRAVWVQIAHLVATDKKRATQPLRTWFNRGREKARQENGY